MEYLVIKVKSQEARRLEEELALFELDGLEILNPQDSMYYRSSWDVDEAPPAQEGDEAILKIYGDKKELARLEEHYKDLILEVAYEEVEKKDWNELWAQQFTGIELEGVFVRPPWLDKKEGLLDVIIEPGMAFGTGSHETTLLCLGGLIDYMKKGYRVIDVGTGSGILAIVAKLMGASYALGTEIDESALKNALLNKELNKVEVDFKEGDLLKGIDQKANIIVANILPTILKDMKEDAYRLLEDQGILMLSGILDKRVDDLVEFYSDSFKLLDNRSMGLWHLLIMERR